MIDREQALKKAVQQNVAFLFIVYFINRQTIRYFYCKDQKRYNTIVKHLNCYPSGVEIKEIIDISKISDEELIFLELL